ncbi:hypothetical protein CEUSTIGMA_g7571.t1 [Chlamydomonas eustigma]|uniref:BZIP domain-containing protein n=1 Tax=Chlamydomonas eustigma TaxID=1157962 RepID=A0A250XAI8_9CHLO|nr:hypothetical protein CEUSTIGMA_g7571.t1 [Chlamydomonas eustigma]|eukprot:GAX80133.1 hypothetical protein CEUSTIGMA_g7571.t1 [Chlamydomonas eustigma]
MFSDLFKCKSSGPPGANGLANGQFNPFSKTSFDALLETLDVMEGPAAETGENTFPVITGGPLNSQTRSMPWPSLTSTGHKSRLSLDSASFQQMSGQVNAFNKRPSQCGLSDYPGMHGDFLVGLPSISGVGPQATLYPVVSTTADDYELPAKRLSSSGKRGSHAPSPSTSERRLSDMDGMGSESSILNRHERHFALHPRASVESLGGMVCVDNSGYSSGGGSGKGHPTDRKEKNRIAQRRFRERQKMTVSSLQGELDAKEAILHRMHAQMRVLEQTNMTLTSRLLEYEKMYGPLFPPTPEALR